MSGSGPVQVQSPYTKILVEARSGGARMLEVNGGQADGRRGSGFRMLPIL